MTAVALAESDAFALSMLCVILLSLGTLFTLLCCMFRNVARRDPEVDRLIEELEEAERLSEIHPARAMDLPKREWEREGDWWKS